MRALVLACVVATGCVDEFDTDVWIVLPTATPTCATLGAGRAIVDVATREGERFSLVAPACGEQLEGQEFAGYHLVLARVTSEYHRLVARIENVDGDVIGEIAKPFAGDEVQLLTFDRADLPNWPSAHLVVTVPGCANGELAEVAVIATPTGADRPAFEGTLPCTPDATVALTVPRGPLTIRATAQRLDGGCVMAQLQTYAADEATPSLVFSTRCP